MTILGAGAFPALQLRPPEIDVAGAFQQGRQDAAVNTSNDLANQAGQIDMLAHGAAAALDQGPNGPINTGNWNSFLDTLQQTGMDPQKVEAFRSNPEIARVLLRGSSEALKNQYDAAAFDRSLQLLDAQIGQALSVTAKNNAPPLGTDDEQEYRKAVEQGFEGTFMDFKKALQAPGTVVNVNPDGSSGGASTTKFQTDLGGLMAKDYGQIRDDAKAARTGLATLGVMENAISDPSFYSGFGSDQLLALKRFGAAIGIDPEGVSSMETFNALNKQAALASMGGSLGTGFSNADRDFVTGQVPSLENTVEGNRQLIAIQRKINERKIEIAELATDYVQKHGVLDAGFEDELAAFAEANPLFTDEAGDAEPDLPSPGDIVDGYEYVGGDPASEKSWKKVN